MKIGIREKLVLSFATMLLFPILIVLLVGSNVDNGTGTIFILIVAQAIPFVICAAVLSGMIARSFIVPLKELYAATEKIKAGNLEFEIKYRKKNEMGDFCAAFDLMRAQLKDSLEKQKLLEQSRKTLIASISHDLRTPMSSIKGYVEGLQDGIVHDKERFERYIAVIKNKTESLDNLIESLFQYSQQDIDQSESGMHIRGSKELLDAIVNPIEAEFVDLPIRLEVIRPFPSVQLYVNEGSIAQVFDNIISNAKRYTKENGLITIKADKVGGYLRIAITDNGEGISGQDLPLVFDQFYRAEKSRSRNYGGAGLGLAICQMIIEKHGGRIGVESIQNTMTRFSFHLPTVKKDSHSGTNGSNFVIQ